jgi:hypothetical protein
LCDVAADCACRESSILYTYLSWRHCWTLCCQFTPIPHNATQHNTTRKTRKTTRKTSWSYAAACTTPRHCKNAMHAVITRRHCVLCFASLLCRDCLLTFAAATAESTKKTMSYLYT